MGRLIWEVNVVGCHDLQTALQNLSDNGWQIRQANGPDENFNFTIICCKESE